MCSLQKDFFHNSQLRCFHNGPHDQGSESKGYGKSLQIAEWECGVWDWFTGRDEPEVTEACLGLRFVCHAEQDGPWSQVDIYLESNELTEYSVEDRERKYSVLLKEGIATFSYCEVFVGI